MIASGLGALALSSATPPSSAACVPVPSGCVGWWPGESDATDVAGGHNGTVNSAVTFVPGEVGQAFGFHAAGNTLSKVSVPDDPIFKLTNALTLEAWVNVTTFTPAIILMRGDNRGGLDPYGLAVNPDGNVYFFIDDASNEQAFLTAPLSVGQWKHVAGVFDGSSGDMKLYVDGVLSARTNTPVRPLGDLDPGSEPAIGIGNHGGTVNNFPFDGLIDEASIYGRALSGSEIQSIFNAGSAGKCRPTTPPPCVPSPSGLVGWWPFEGNGGDLASGNSVMLSSNAVFGGGKVGQALLFDGAHGDAVVEPTPALNVGAGGGFTVEGWIDPSNVASYQTIFEWDNRQGLTGLQMGISQVQPYGGGPGSIWANLIDVNQNAHWFPTAGGLIGSNTWSHFALTYDKASGVSALYVNGAGVGQTNFGAISVETRWELFFGERVVGANRQYRFAGGMDEMSLYNRSLSAAEVKSIFDAGAAGKCKTPAGPTIVAQPQSQTVVAGGSATFMVVASGALPLSYQWRFGAGDLSGATNSSLTLSNVQSANAGNYSVKVANAAGFVTSSNALLTIAPPPPCVAPPAGLVSWWTGDGDAMDRVGGNNGTLPNGASFVAGEVGLGFHLDGVNEYVNIPDSPSLSFTNELTLETWFKKEQPWVPNTQVFLFDKRDLVSGNYAASFSIEYGMILAFAEAPSGAYQYASAPLPTAGVFHHFAGTYRQADATHVELKIYLDGQLVQGGMFPGNLAKTVNNGALTLGGPRGLSNFFPGIIDEPAIYNRALTAVEIQSIFNAGAAGKCRPSALSPSIVSQPSSQTVVAGGSATFMVVASGTPPLSYQWRFGAGDLSGATNSSLTLSNVQSANAGNYSVRVANSAGSITSSDASLTVNPLPAGPTYDLSRDFSLASNPNGVWSYGAKSTIGGAFSLLPFSQNQTVQAGVVVQSWMWANGVQPVIAHYSGTAIWTNSGGRGIFPPGTVTCDSGTDNSTQNFAVIRFTVPSGGAGSYQLQTAVHSKYDGSLSADSDFHVVLNGVEIYGLFMPPNSGTGYTNTLALAVGDTIDLMVGRGADGIQYASGLKIQATLNLVSPNPVAPTIVSQPQSQTVTVGSDVSFSVTANGTPPLSYQWRFGAGDLSGATNSSLTLSSVQSANAGNYSVKVANAAGSVISSNALLTITPPPPCVAPPAGLVSWWTGDGDAMDRVGGNNGTLPNGASFVAGEVGLGFHLDGVNEYVNIPDSPSLSFTNELTLETWFKKEQPWVPNTQVFLFDKRDLVSGNYAASFSIEYGMILAFAEAPSGAYQYASAPLPTAGVFHHFAGTYRQADATHVELKIYLDGQLVQSGLFSGNLAKTENNGDLTLGGPRGLSNFFPGIIDEPAIYSRALTAVEIQSIFNAGAAGKCKPSTLSPSIVSQPSSQTVVAGGSATFTVVAAGTPPLSYQWRLNTTSLGGKTNATLVLSNVQPGQAGNYSVVVVNAGGSVTSSNAVLTVVNPQTCAALPSGAVGWWPFESNANDILGTNSAKLSGNPLFAAGEVGAALVFDGANDYAVAAASPGLDVGAGSGLTIEAWINPTDIAQLRPIAEWNDGTGNIGTHFWISTPTAFAGGPGSLFGNLIDPSGTSHQISTTTGLVSANVFQHVALTYDKTSGATAIYLNGNAVAQTNLGSLTPQTRYPFYFGSRPSGPFSGIYFKGVMDEVSLYGRALSAAQIQSIFSAGTAGKCLAPAPPAIAGQPQSQTVTVGANVSFAVTAIGTPPLSYQWRLNTTSLSGKTNATLVLSNVQPSQAGNYSVVVANAGGSVTSSNALLTVNPLPPCVPAPSGLVSWWPGDGDAMDLAGANNASLQNGASFAAGEVGLGFHLDGVNQYINIPDSPSLSFTNELTLETWFKKEQPWVPNTQVFLFDKRDLVSGNYAASFSIEYGMILAFAEAPSGAYQYASAPLPTAGVFHHFAGTYRQADATHVELKIYLDGQLVQGGMFPGNLAKTVNNGALTLGGPRGLSNFFPGIIDEPAIYNRALTAAEIQSIFNAGAAGKCKPSPVAPLIVSQPASQTLVAGGTATFTVVANGTPPLSYQWRLNTTSLSGKTNATLVLSNVQPSQAGSYSVVVANAGGSTTSSNAVLTVLNPQTCVALPSGAVGWWPFEGNANDIIGTNSAKLSGNPLFAAGEVGSALVFDGANDYAVAAASPSLDVGAGSGLTIEAWINPTDITQLRPIAEWNDGAGNIGTLFWISVATSFGGGPGSLFGSIGDLSGGTHQISTTTGLLSAKTFQHVALTYDKTSGAAAIYLNGSALAQTNLGSFTPQTRYPLYFGLRPSGPFSGIYFKGMMDEVSLYGRALSAGEIQSIFSAGTAGKCLARTPPAITLQPQNQSVFVGQGASFSVAASGTPPLTFQWYFSTNTVPNATNAVLPISSATLGQAGEYSVVVANASGSVTSSVAVLVVNPLPPCASPANGLISWWPLNGDASDVVGTNAATLFGSPSFGNGEAGEGLIFDGVNDYASAAASPSLNVGVGNGFTVEVWIKPSDVTQLRPIVEWNSGSGGIGTLFWTSVPVGTAGGPGSLNANIVDLAGVSHHVVTPTGLLTANVFQHVALTYDKPSGAAVIYLNGTPVVQTNLGSITAQTSYPLYFGLRPSGPFSNIHFLGIMDEVSLYSRALASAEIQSIFNAGSAGKCKPSAVVPSIVSQPQSVVTTGGDTVTFSVQAQGTSPLRYQWFFNDAPITGATAPSLTLNSVSRSDAGPYDVLITNSLGSITSAVVRLTLLNRAPVASSQSVVLNEDTTALITLVASDPDGDPLTYAVMQPSHGTLTGTPPIVTYRPQTEYFGPDSFTFKVNDGQVDSVVATVDITVAEVNEPPVAKAAIGPLAKISPNIKHPQVLSINGSNAVVVLDGSLSSDEENDPLGFTWATNGVAFATGPVLVKVLPVGSYTLTLSVSEAKASSTDTLLVDIITLAEATAEVSELVRDPALAPKYQKQLNQHLKQAIAAFEKMHAHEGVDHLHQFQDTVRDAVTRIDPGLAASLIRAAEVIIDGVDNNGSHFRARQ